MENKHVAQVTGVPANGASNAADFQPPTQNPQQAPSGLQQGGSLNGLGSNQEILTDNPNARIIVPVNPADPNPQTLAETSGGGFNWLMAVIVLIVIAGVAFAWVQSYRGKKGAGLKMYETTPEPAVNKPSANAASVKTAQSSPKTITAKPTKTAKPSTAKPMQKKKSRKGRRKNKRG